MRRTALYVAIAVVLSLFPYPSRAEITLSEIVDPVVLTSSDCNFNALLDGNVEVREDSTREAITEVGILGSDGELQKRFALAFSNCTANFEVITRVSRRGLGGWSRLGLLGLFYPNSTNRNSEYTIRFSLLPLLVKAHGDPNRKREIPATLTYSFYSSPAFPHHFAPVIDKVIESKNAAFSGKGILSFPLPENADNHYAKSLDDIQEIKIEILLKEIEFEGTIY